MKTKESKERRNNNQLRRNTMNATKLTIIALSAAAIMFSGCSTDNHVLGPVSDLQSEIGAVTLDRVDINSNEAAPGPKYFVIVAKVLSLDIEGGCWYLQADDGNTYTPVTPKDLTLEDGLKFKAEGYQDDNIQFFCGNGPAFVIESYEIIGKPGMSDDERNSEIKTENGPSNEEPVLDDMSFEDRAPSNSDDDRYSYEYQMNRELENKKKLEEEKGMTEKPKDESAPSMSDNDDDNDQFVRPVDDSRSQDEVDNRELENKKKLEEEKRNQDQDNERP
jgi:hypothetical protein